METNFKLWLEAKEKETKGGFGSKLLALAVPIGGALAGGAAGTAAFGPLGAIPGGIAGKELGVRLVRNTKGALELMKK